MRPFQWLTGRNFNPYIFKFVNRTETMSLNAVQGTKKTRGRCVLMYVRVRVFYSNAEMRQNHFSVAVQVGIEPTTK